MTDPGTIYLQVHAINGLTVRTTVGYWNKIVTFKHPSMAGREDEVRTALEQPDEIRQSVTSENVLLYYRRLDGYHICVVVRALGQEGFIVTTYLTDKVKEGTRIWRN